MARLAARTGWHALSALAVGTTGTGYLILQKGWADPTVWVPLAAIAFPFVLELLKRRDNRSEKDKEREAALDDRMQKVYEREITGLEKSLTALQARYDELEKRYTDACTERDRLRDEKRRTPPSARRRGGDVPPAG